MLTYIQSEIEVYTFYAKRKGYLGFIDKGN